MARKNRSSQKQGKLSFGTTFYVLENTCKASSPENGNLHTATKSIPNPDLKLRGKKSRCCEKFDVAHVFVAAPRQICCTRWCKQPLDMCPTKAGATSSEFSVVVFCVRHVVPSGQGSVLALRKTGVLYAHSTLGHHSPSVDVAFAVSLIRGTSTEIGCPRRGHSSRLGPSVKHH